MAEKVIIMGQDDKNKSKNKVPPLALCLLLDALGCITYFAPALGELADVVWAPISALIFNYLFGGKLGKIGAVLNFIEEIVPWTDFIPSFTIAYFIRKSGNSNG